MRTIQSLMSCPRRRYAATWRTGTSSSTGPELGPSSLTIRTPRRYGNEADASLQSPHARWSSPAEEPQASLHGGGERTSVRSRQPARPRLGLVPYLWLGGDALDGCHHRGPIGLDGDLEARYPRQPVPPTPFACGD
jgi:hypothetical protein